MATIAPTGRAAGEEGVSGPEGPTTFEWVQAAFGEAMRTCPDLVSEASYSFAGRCVRMRIVGRRLAQRVAIPFAHLRLEDHHSANVELLIDLWSECEAGVPGPVTGRPSDVKAGWEVGGGRLTASSDGRFLRFLRLHSQTWLDRMARQIVGWRACGTVIPTVERSKPMLPLLAIWYSDRDVHLGHAGLVGLDGQGVLVAGPSGSGKSTTTLACLGAGLEYLGDDYTGLEELADGSFVGHSVYSTARLQPEQVARLPFLAEAAIESDDPYDQKYLVPAFQVSPDRVRRATPIRAVALPRVVGSGAPRLRPATKGQAFMRLAPSSLAMLLSPGRHGLDRLERLVDRVPSYWLDLADDVTPIPSLVEQIVTRASLPEGVG